MNNKRYSLARACNLWNALSCPWELRTKAEMTRKTKAARKVYRWILRDYRARIDYREWDSGRMTPID